MINVMKCGKRGNEKLQKNLVWLRDLEVFHEKMTCNLRPELR